MFGTRTYDEIPEDTLSPEDPNRQPDGRSFYRGLARQLLGDPKSFNDIVGEVLHHYLRIFFNSRHPLHAQYHSIDGEYFYRQLSRPDLSQSKYDLLKVLEIISNALRVQIFLQENDGKITQIGSIFENLAQCRLLVRGRQEQYVASSMIPEDSGKDIIDYMSAEKTQNTRLNIKQIKWWWDSASESTKFECANEFVSKVEFNRLSPTPPLRTYGRQTSGEYGYSAIFSNFVVNVKTPIEIKPAVDLLLKILPLSPGQGIPVNVDFSKTKVDFRKTHAARGRLLPYVGIDAEFKLVSHDPTISEEDLQNMANDDGSEAENLCTILTIAVDRHVTFHFHIFHMLEQGSLDTVSELEYLWRKVIFNEELLKIWFNFQSDITVLDNTIAHLYQGSARKSYFSQLGPGRQDMKIEPRWRLTRHDFQGERPEDLIFPKVDDKSCVFHEPLGAHAGRDIACPCRTGNLDLEAIIAHVRRQLGLRDKRGEDGGETTSLRHWTKERRGFGYVKLLQQFLKNDWMFPILNHLKDAPNRWVEQNTYPEHYNDADGGDEGGGGGNKPNKAGFFRSFGPSMESDSDKMGYNIGDVVGIALIFRFLTTTDDRKLLFARLRNISDNEQAHTQGIKPRQSSFNMSTKSAQDKGIPLIRDNPRSWKVEISDMWDTTKKAPWTARSTYLANCNYSYAAHEKLIKTVLAIKQDIPLLSPREIREETKYRLYDPCGFKFPPIMAKVPGIPDQFKPPVIQGMELHCEDLYRRICDARPLGRSSKLVVPRDLRSAGTNEGDIERRIMDDEMTRVVIAAQNGPPWESSTEMPMKIGDYLPIAVDRAVSAAEAEVTAEAAANAKEHPLSATETEEEEVSAEAAAKSKEHPLPATEAKDQETAMDFEGNECFNTDPNPWGLPSDTQNIEQEIPDVEMKNQESSDLDPVAKKWYKSKTEGQEVSEEPWLIEEVEDEEADGKRLKALRVIEHLVKLKEKLTELRWCYRVKPDDLFDDWGQKYAERLSEAPPFEQNDEFHASNAMRTVQIQDCFKIVNVRIKETKRHLNFGDDDDENDADEDLKNPPLIIHRSSGPSPNAGPSTVHRAERKRPRESSTAPLRRSKRIRREPDRLAKSSR